MSSIKNSSTIFLSYSWKNTTYADEIDDHFKALGITFLRDIRDVVYKSSIKDFMHKVGESDYVLMLISDEFLSSVNCMYEVMELMRDRKFKDRMLQVILPNARVFDIKYRMEKVRHWEKLTKELKSKSQEIDIENSAEIAEDIKHYSNICSDVGPFLKHLSDYNSSPYAELKSKKFQPILNHIGFSDDKLISELSELLKIEDNEEKEIALEEFTISHPEYARGFLVRGYVERVLNHGRFRKEIYYYGKAIAIDPNYVMAYINRGAAKSDLGDNKGAIEDCDKAIAIDSNIAMAYYNRGVSKYFLGDYNEAIEDYNEAIAIDPNDTIMYYNRGKVKSDLGNYKEAIKDYGKAIAIDPNNTIAYVNRGGARSDLGDNKGAIEDYNEAIAIDPKYVIAYNNRGLLKTVLGDNKGAIEDYNEAIAIDPNNVITYNNRGLLKTVLGDDKGAIEDYNEAIAIDPNNVKAYVNRGAFKSVLGYYKGAIEDYNEAIAIDPNNAMAYTNRGNSKSVLGDYKRAIKDYNKAISIDPNDAKAYYNRGLLKTVLGNNKGAREDYDEAIAIDPSLKK